MSFDSADGPFGSNLKREHYTFNQEVRIIQLSNIGEFGWREENKKYTTFSHLENISRSEAFAGDIIIAKMMPAGRAIICPSNEKKYVLSSDAVRFSFSLILNRSYIYFAINSPIFLDQVYGDVHGITRVRTSLTKLRSYLLPVPPLNEQERIVNEINHLVRLTFEFELKQNALNELNNTIRASLKKSILQEAIKGRLVSQCATDEPASFLLEQIRNEKKRLVKEGKLKKSALEDSVIFKGDDNKYYEQIDGQLVEAESETQFPQSWQVCRLSFICQLTDGTKYRGKHICLDAKYLRGKSDGSLLEQGKFVSKGDTIILVDGENSGEVFTVPINGYMGSTFKQLWVSEKMNLQYVLYVIRFYKEMLRNSKKGAAIPHLNKQLFYNIIVGIPPIEEQARIVAKTHQLFQLSD